MNFKTHLLTGALAALTLAGTWSFPAQVLAQEEEQQDAEVLTRGPIHEAFAGTISNEPETSEVISAKPPEAIEEEPPDQRPDGDNVTWIPGYWAWDDEPNDFLWISGIWRALPPDREWVPGYWSEANGGWQWISGYWEDSEADEVVYLPEPPKSLETGPTAEAVSEDDTWIPGNWGWRQTRYVWRPGYWTAGRADWAWTPSYYRRTHRGYIHVSGFWDHSIARRGVVFAPVRFHRGIYARPGYRYTPFAVVATGVFLNHLFVRPHYGHYYFGDYYEPVYRNRGFYASFSYFSGRRGYDPIYAHYHWHHRHDRNWANGRRDYYNHRINHHDARPPRTWAALNSHPDRDYVQRYDRFVADRDGRTGSFRKVTDDDRRQFATQRQEVRKFSDDRRERESKGDKAMPNKEQAVSEKRTGRSPVIAKKDSGDAPKRLEERDGGKDNGKNTKGDNGPDGADNKGKGDNAGKGEKGEKGDKADKGEKGFEKNPDQRDNDNNNRQGKGPVVDPPKGGTDPDNNPGKGNKDGDPKMDKNPGGNPDKGKNPDANDGGNKGPQGDGDDASGKKNKAGGDDEVAPPAKKQKKDDDSVSPPAKKQKKQEDSVDPPATKKKNPDAVPNPSARKKGDGSGQARKSGGNGAVNDGYAGKPNKKPTATVTPESGGNANKKADSEEEDEKKKKRKNN